MAKKGRAYKKFCEGFNVDLRDCSYIGEGHNGIVYLMPDGKLIKIFRDRKICSKECSILERAGKSRHFPSMYACGDNYIIKDYVDGQCLKDYIKENGLDREMAVKLMNLLEELKKLGFTRLDTRCRDIYINKEGLLIIIDPKSAYTRTVNYPRHLAKGLEKMNVLYDFLDFMREEKPSLYKSWAEKIVSYIASGDK